MKYKLLEKQREFIQIPHRKSLDVAIYQGGYGSGKTWCGSLLGILLARKYAGSRGLVGAKEYELVRKTTLVKYLEHLEALGYCRGRNYTYNKVDKIIKFKNGSEIMFCALDDPEKYKSIDIHWAEIEEASQVGDSCFKQLMGRLRNTYRGCDWGDFQYRLFGHTNPEPTKGWIYERFVENRADDESTAYRLVIAPTSSNVFLPEHYIKGLKSAYDEEYYRINVLGEFGDYTSGLVVKGFSDENKRNFVYNTNLPLHVSCDFNVDPMSWTIAHKDENNVFFIDEIVLENTTTQQTAEEFLRRYPKHQAEIIINGDASGDNRSTNSEFTNYAIIRNALRAHGYKDVTFNLRPYNPPILNRVAAFNAKVRNSEGIPSLFIDPRRCKWLLHNINNLKFKAGTSIIDIPSHYQIKHEHTNKFLSHIFDAASYLTEYYWAIR